MPVVVDTCGWIEWLTDGSLADRYEPYLNNLAEVIVPTSVQFELYKWVCREASESKALEAISLTEQGCVSPLTTSIALAAADCALAHKLSFADAIIYATARHHRAQLVTSDGHFQGLADVEFFAKSG